nr:MAG TPA: hypothetical protein [Inoviridae sp.]
MIARVLGVQYLDYVSRKTGNPVKGLSLHCAYKDQQVEGEAVSNFFVSDNLGISLKFLPGDTVDIAFNQRGSICDVKQIPAKN